MDAIKNGHEIGNHSISHTLPLDFSDQMAENETIAAKKILEQKLGTQIYSYAYPYTITTPQMVSFLSKSHVAARVGQMDAIFMQSADTPDWYGIESVVTLSDIPANTYIGWIDKSIEHSAWTVFQIHAVEGTTNGYQPIPVKSLEMILDYLVANNEIWVAPFGAISTYWKAKKAIEKALKIIVKDGIEYKWKPLSPFPLGVMVKIMVKDFSNRIYIEQNGKRVELSNEGIYCISFDEGSMELHFYK